jgi:molybdopterin-guanine dinucleotide biosynthesis protein A
VADSKVLVAVLAGGAARRLGGAKAMAELGGKPLLAYPLAAAAAAGLDTVVVAKAGTPLPAFEADVLFEPEEPVHPLCGVLAAMEQAENTRDVLALGCDMPFLTPALLSWMATLDGPAVLESGGRLQPLPGRYPARSRARLAEAIHEGEAMGSTLASLGARVIDEAELSGFGEPRRLCFNVNERADLERAREMLAAREGEDR